MSQAMAPLRAEIDDLDDQIVDLLARRFAVVRRVAPVKAAHGLPVVIPDRVHQVIDRNAERGGAGGLDPAFVARLYQLIIDEACRVERSLLGEAET